MNRGRYSVRGTTVERWKVLDFLDLLNGPC